MLNLFPVTVMSAETENAVSEKTGFRNVENSQKSLGADAVKFEVIAHGKGLGMLLAKNADENPELREKLSKLHADGVGFAPCENTMNRRLLFVTGLPLRCGYTVA